MVSFTSTVFVVLLAKVTNGYRNLLTLQLNILFNIQYFQTNQSCFEQCNIWLMPHRNNNRTETIQILQPDFSSACPVR